MDTLPSLIAQPAARPAARLAGQRARGGAAPPAAEAPAWGGPLAQLGLFAPLQAPFALPVPSEPPASCPPAASDAPAADAAPSQHPALWRAAELARPSQAGLESGFAALDAQLPGGGWPARALTELLLPHPGIGELRLVAPVLAALQRQQHSVLWLDPPAEPCAAALQALGIDLRQLVIVRPRQPLPRPVRKLLPAADILWALEQALKGGHLGAVLAWLPAALPADALRRLQLAAQGHDGPVFLLRDVQVRARSSPAPLRLLLESAGPDLLRVGIFKRRGPPLVAPLLLELPPVLSAPALARALHAAVPASVAARTRLPSTPEPLYEDP